MNTLAILAHVIDESNNIQLTFVVKNRLIVFILKVICLFYAPLAYRLKVRQIVAQFNFGLFLGRYVHI